MINEEAAGNNPRQRKKLPAPYAFQAAEQGTSQQIVSVRLQHGSACFFRQDQTFLWNKSPIQWLITLRVGFLFCLHSFPSGDFWAPAPHSPRTSILSCRSAWEQH